MTPYEKIQAKIALDVERVGWSAIGVFGESEENPSFTYTIGLDQKGLPELLVVGLPSQYAHAFIAQYIEAMAVDGVLDDKTVSTDYADGGLRLAFCDVDPTTACNTYMFHTENFLGVPPDRVQQLVWADPSNILPFEAGCDKRMARMQSRVRDYRTEVV